MDPFPRPLAAVLALLLGFPDLASASPGADAQPQPPPEGVAAETAPEDRPQAPAGDSGFSAGALWERTQETAGDWWRGSRDLAGQAWEDARGMWGERGDGFERVWDEVVPTLDRTLSLEERQDQLPKSAWFGPDQASNRADIEALLDEAVEILSVSPVQRFRERSRAIRTEIERARADIAEYRQRRISAPSESALKRTVADYDRLIAEREADIARLGEEQRQVERELATAVRSLGVELTDEQAQFLLSTVVGDQMVDLGVLFDNVKAVTGQLEELVAESGEDLQAARRYYGMYVVLLRALRHMHLEIEESVAERYVPQIDSIVARTQALRGETLRLQRDNPAKRALLAANLEAQGLTVEAAGVYRRYLLEQANRVRQARLELDKDIAAAWNTYETVRVSGELVGLVRSSQRLLEGLTSREIPALRPFENLELRQEFEKLTEQLRRGQG